MRFWIRVTWVENSPLPSQNNTTYIGRSLGLSYKRVYFMMVNSRTNIGLTLFISISIYFPSKVDLTLFISINIYLPSKMVRSEKLFNHLVKEIYIILNIFWAILDMLRRLGQPTAWPKPPYFGMLVGAWSVTIAIMQRALR